jgi:hypothetical protein
MVEKTIPGLTGLFAGWTAEQYYSTIQFADLNNDQRLDVCGRAADGMHCYINTPTSTSPYFSFVETSTGFTGLFNDSPYSDQTLYKSIRVLNLPNNRPGMFARTQTSNSLIYTLGVLDGSEAIEMLTGVVARAVQCCRK